MERDPRQKNESDSIRNGARKENRKHNSRRAEQVTPTKQAIIPPQRTAPQKISEMRFSIKKNDIKSEVNREVQV